MKLLKILIPVAVVIIIVAIVVPIVVVFTKSQDPDDPPVVNTTAGLIRGLRAEDGSTMFLGIPYAVVDEKNPFGAAKPNPTFDGVFDAFNDSARCPQSFGLQQTSLDCLHLHIHVPKTTDHKPLPVFVYIHGGGFFAGSSGRDSFGPKFLIRHNVIFVSFNYRLAVYGFMCLHTPEVPGNQGLKDQLAALRWIKKNIKAFGGNEESITIAGDSAGGVSVDSQLLYADEGLFHKVIILSGTTLSPWGYQEPDLNAAFKLAAQLGFQTNITTEAIQFLSNQTVTDVMIAANHQQLRFMPCVEKEFPNVESFATTHPVSIPLTKARNVPIICGYTDDEWLLTHLWTPPEVFESLDIFNQNLNIGFQLGEKHDTMKMFVRRFYAGDEPMSVSLRRAVTDFDSDFLFAHPTQRTLGKYLDYGGVAYHYVFSYIGGRNMIRFRFNITEGGAAHADDLGYFFDLPDMTDTPSPQDQLMVDRITTLWTNFAKYGNPTPSTTDLLPVQWLPVTRERLNYLNINNPLQISTRPFNQRLSFWDFFYHINRDYVRGQETDDSPLVNTTVGLIRGLRADDGSTMFLGIPYAIVDEKNPFGAAIPNPKFVGVFDAFNDSARCPQSFGLQQTSLDCLHLHIHVPKTTDNKPLPVFVYIHGGGFFAGSSGRDSFGPKFLIRHNVIFVSFNYRLAVYGFMCLDTPEVPGNQGLKDQLAALRWIKNNIKAFGGDENSITIAGDSAGGVSVDSQLLYADEGLFHKVIILSGTTLSPWGYPEPDLNAALKLAAEFGFQTNNTTEAIQFLSNQTVTDVMIAANRQQLRFMPCVEKEFPNVESFATRHPVNTPLTKARNVPIICGYTDDEWLLTHLWTSPEVFERLDIFNQNLHNGFQLGEKHDTMKMFVRRFYAGDEPMSVSLRRAVTDFDSDFLFAHPTQRTLGKYLDYGGVAYHYVFSYIGGRNMNRFRFNITEGGAAHADDLGYFFDLPDMTDTPSPQDQLMVDRITTLWTNFAKYGNPTPSTTALLPVQWLPVTRERLNYLNINNPLQISTRPFNQRLSFWDFFYHINRDYVRGQETDDSPLVNTTVGLIRGLRADDGSTMFLGIPYAIVDEKNPFGAAIPNPKFDGVFDAVNDSARCPQIFGLRQTSLDCLHLHIHVPKTTASKPLPVFVYIHGGGFFAGSSGRDSFGPKFLIRHNVIFVSFNYRLAVYGFMCLDTPEVPGNQGLKDQLAALRWIKNNIKAFGGDENSITIAGDSAGGVSVDSQLLYADEDLFHKVIILSGTTLSPWGYQEPDLNAAFKLTAQLGFQTNITAEAIQFLSNQTVTNVIIAATLQQLSFMPCVEKEFPNVESFATRHPVNTPLTKARNVPIICGYTDDEWLLTHLWTSPEVFERLDIFNQNLNIGFQLGEKHDTMKMFVRRFYAGDEPMSVSLRRAVTDFDSDFLFAHPTQRTLGKYLDYGGVAYHYVFSYIGGRNMNRFRFNITEGGAAHADDLGYFFDLPDMTDTPSPQDQLMVDRITTLWTNFAKYGNPTPSTTDLLPVQWLPVTRERLNYLNINNPLQISTRPFNQRLSFLDFFYHINRDYVRGYSGASNVIY